MDSAAIHNEPENDDGDGDPTRPHALQAAAFSAIVGIPLLAAARKGRLPATIPARDLALIGVATHKMSRLITKDKITDFLRAPFTEHEGHAHLNEVNVKARGEGLQHAMGEMLSCPFCTGAWLAGLLVVGTVYAPRITRAVTGMFTALSVADFLHIAYAGAADAVEG
ncbi:MAG: DUF1360 domain-containing protein [Actinomycetota bacterium]|nr:DUF1360 domain-containing protein [Actinomycetota bacterium]